MLAAESFDKERAAALQVIRTPMRKNSSNTMLPQRNKDLRDEIKKWRKKAGYIMQAVILLNSRHAIITLIVAGL